MPLLLEALLFTTAVMCLRYVFTLEGSTQVADVFKRHLPPYDAAAWRSLVAAEQSEYVEKANFSQFELRGLSEVTTVTFLVVLFIFADFPA